MYNTANHPTCPFTIDNVLLYGSTDTEMVKVAAVIISYVLFLRPSPAPFTPAYFMSGLLTNEPS